MVECLSERNKKKEVEEVGRVDTFGIGSVVVGSEVVIVSSTSF